MWSVLIMGKAKDRSWKNREERELRGSNWKCQKGVTRSFIRNQIHNETKCGRSNLTSTKQHSEITFSFLPSIVKVPIQFLTQSNQNCWESERNKKIGPHHNKKERKNHKAHIVLWNTLTPNFLLSPSMLLLTLHTLSSFLPCHLTPHLKF